MHLSATNEIPIIFLMGPTATGKTDLAIQIAKTMPVEIINVDSALIYKGMDIGTGKPSQTIMNEIPHHLVDIRDPSESYSVNEFCNDASQLIQEIQARNKIPLLVGGTFLYFYTLKYGISPLPTKNDTVRLELEKQRQTHGLEFLYDKLVQIDPELANRIHANDPQRILRALEIYYLTKQKPSELYQTWQTFLSDSQPIIEVGIIPQDRAFLHRRIEQRFLKMLEQGFIDEVKMLYQRSDLNLNFPALRCVGYRQIWQYLAGELPFEEMKQKAIVATRQLAKRQITWLRKFNEAHLFYHEHPQLLQQVLDLIIHEANVLVLPKAF